MSTHRGLLLEHVIVLVERLYLLVCDVLELTLRQPGNDNAGGFNTRGDYVPVLPVCSHYENHENFPKAWLELLTI